MPTAAASERHIPHNLEAERALLGSILLDNGALGIALEMLSKDDFYSQGHRLAFERMIELSERGRAIDLVTLSEELSKDGLLEKSGGAAYLAALTDGVPIGTSAALGEYCRIVLEKSQARKIINLANGAISRILSGVESWSEVSSDAISALIALEAGTDEHCRTYRDAAVSLLKKLEEKNLPRVCTGLSGIDDRTGGFLPDELIIFSAKSGVGKTLLAQQTRRWACRHGLHALFASCEMPDEQLVGREIATAARMPHRKLRRPESIESHEYKSLLDAAVSQCSSCAILHGVLTIAKVAAAARKQKADGRLNLLIIDYDELVSAPGKNENERLANVATGAWQLAVSLHIPVILISQMRKSGEGEGGAGTVLDQLYGSGAKSKHASTVIYIHRDFKGDQADDLQPASVGVAKDRHGDVGWSEVWFSKQRLEFLNKEIAE